MSDQESDLDFESADEGGLKGEDIDTSDLDIDENEDDNLKGIVEKNSKNIHTDQDSLVKLKEEEDSFKVATTKAESKPELEIIKKKINLGPKEPETIIASQSPVKLGTGIHSGWDADAEFSDIDNDNDQRNEVKGNLYTNPQNFSKI